MHHILKIAALVTFTAFAAVNAFAQKPERHQYAAYSTQTGMASQIIIDIEEDTNGFIWMLGDNSLQWFDGSKFNEIPYGEGIHEIPATQFLALHHTKENELWIFYTTGFSVYNTSTHSFAHYNHLIPLQNGIVMQPVVELNDVLVIENGSTNFYVSKKLKKIVKQQPVAHKRLTNSLQSQATLANPAIEFYNGYVTTSNYSVAEKDSFTLFATTKLFTPYSLNKRQLLVFDDSKVSLYNLGNFMAAKQITYPNGKKLISYQRPVNIIKKDSKKITIILDDELWDFDVNLLKFARQITNLQSKPFLTNGYFKSIFYDSRGNLWAGSNLQGLFKINTTVAPVQLIKANTEKDNFIKCFVVNNNSNKVIAGTYGSGIQIFDTAGTHLKSILIAPAGPTSFNIVSSIGKIDDNNYLVLVFNNKTQYILNTDFYTLTALKHKVTGNHPSPEFQPNYYSQLTDLGNKQFLYLKQDNELYSLAVQDDKLLIKQAKDVERNLFRSDISKPVKNIGLALFDNQRYFARCLQNAALGNVPVTYLCKWKNNWLVGTTKGVYLFDPAAKLITAYNKQTGLLNENINALIIDKDNNAWCSHDKGLSKLTAAGNIENFTKEDGLQDNEFNYSAASIDENGKLYFGGINGISSFYPNQLRYIADTANLVISRITASNNSIAMDTSFWNLKKVLLQYNDNRLSIFFAAIGMHPSVYYNFQYRISAINNKWIDLKHQEQLNLALPAGNYKIELAVSHLFDPEMVAQKIITVSVSPPYYKTGWFMALVALLFIVAVFYFFRLITWRKYKQRLQIIKEQEILESERNRISRDLHDNIGAYTSALIANVEKLERTETNEGQIIKMKENAGQILSSLRETIWVLNNKEVSVSDFSDNFKITCLKLLKNFDQLTLEVEEEITNNKNIAAATAIHLNKILQEAVQNIIKHSQANIIYLTIVSKEKLEITVTDDGKGYNTGEVLRGNGLDNMEWRAKAAGINFLYYSSPGNGTTIKLLEA